MLVHKFFCASNTHATHLNTVQITDGQNQMTTVCSSDISTTTKNNSSKTVHQLCTQHSTSRYHVTTAYHKSKTNKQMTFWRLA